MKKIDFHCHTTKQKLKNVVPPSATLDYIQEKMQEHEIEKTVLLATYFPHKTSGITNYRMHNWIAGKPEFMMFGSLDFEHYYLQGKSELDEMAENKMISGIKIYTCYQEIDLNSDKIKNVLLLASQNSLPVMFHCGYSYAAKRTYGSGYVADSVSSKKLEHLVRGYPDVDFIIAHLSKPHFDETIYAAKTYPNFYSDMSGLIDSKTDRSEIPEGIEAVKKFANEAGPGKLLFGSDFPVQTHEDAIMFIEEGMKGFSDAEKSLVYYENARRILKC